MTVLAVSFRINHTNADDTTLYPWIL